MACPQKPKSLRDLKKQSPLKGEAFRCFLDPLRNRRGFTLLELMAVLIIMSLVAGLALATFSTTGSRLEQQASSMATVIRTLDDVAAARRETMELKFDFKKRTVSWKSPDGRDRQREFDMLISVEALSLGIVDEGELTVMFDPSYTTESMLVHFETEEERVSVKYNPLGRRTKLIGPRQKDI